RGDRRLADVLERAQRAGARFDGWSDRCQPALWREALAASGLDADFYLRRRPLGETLPWNHLDAGVSERFLRQDLARAVEGVLTPDSSIERCPSSAPCYSATRPNVDCRPAGGRGGERRGERARRGAEWVGRRAAGAALPGGEPRTWRRIRTEVAPRRAARLPVARATRAADAAPLPVALGGDAPTR